MKLLVIKPSSLGDVVHALRVIHQIDKALPNITIDWVIKKGLEGILKASGFINKIYYFRRGSGIISFLRLANEIRQVQYDYVIDLQGLIRSASLTLLANGKTKLGVADGREFSTLFYKCIGEKSRNVETHAIDRLLPFLKHLGIDAYNPDLPLNFSYSLIKKEHNLEKLNKPYLLLFPESRRADKVWPHFEELISTIKKSKEYHVVVAGNVASNKLDGTIDLRGKLSLLELPELIRNSLTVITNDSAPLHIASAMGIPTIAIFGPTSGKRFGPYPATPGKSKILQSKSGKINEISTASVIRAISNMTAS